MTATLISLISIVCGILGAYLLAVFYKKYSLGIVGNTIAGVFGSILFIKSFGRLGFDPVSIVYLQQVNFSLFIINVLVSVFGGLLGLVMINLLKNKMKA